MQEILMGNQIVNLEHILGRLEERKRNLLFNIFWCGGHKLIPFHFDGNRMLSNIFKLKFFEIKLSERKTDEEQIA